MKIKEQEIAIVLRKKGYSYSEILKQVTVSKSTLSLWLRQVGLSKQQRQRLTDKKKLSMQKGWEARRHQRIEKTKKLIMEAHADINKFQFNSQLQWLLGIMLYWAEGSKEKEYRFGQGVSFSNSDPLMIKFFLNWLEECLGLPTSRIKLEIYIHENHKDDRETVRKFWSQVTGFPIPFFGKIYYKKNIINTKRKNVGLKYHGLVRIRVSKSTDLNRKISGWIEAICMQCGVV